MSGALRHRVLPRFSRSLSRINVSIRKRDVVSERSFSRWHLLSRHGFRRAIVSSKAFVKATRPALWIKYAYVIRYTTVVPGDENDDNDDDDEDDEVSALTRAGTMLRYGYQPAHKTALVFPPYAAGVYLNERERAILFHWGDSLSLLTRWRGSL